MRLQVVASPDRTAIRELTLVSVLLHTFDERVKYVTRLSNAALYPGFEPPPKIISSRSAVAGVRSGHEEGGIAEPPNE